MTVKGRSSSLARAASGAGHERIWGNLGTNGEGFLGAQSARTAYDSDGASPLHVSWRTLRTAYVRSWVWSSRRARAR